MCGIVGVITKALNGPSKQTEDTFYDMLYSDSIRGDDSTGVVYVQRDTSFSVLKDQWSGYYLASEFKNSTEGKDMFFKGKAFIGHNRKATVGTISAETAHPFVVDKTFALVHNGTLRGHKKLADTEVDSEALAIHLHKVLGTPDFDLAAFEEAVGKIEGAYAIVCYDQTANKIHMFRNLERPLALLEVGDGWFFGSEGLMVQWCMTRNNVNMHGLKAELVAPNTLYTFDLDKNTLEKVEYVPKKAQAPKTHHGGSAASTVMIPSAGKKGGENGVSKNQFRQMRKRYIYTTLEFWVDDYVEKNFPRTVDDGEKDLILLGESDAFTFDHSIRCEWVLDKYNLLDDLDSHIFQGRVVEMIYNKETKSVTFVLDRVYSIVKSDTSTKKVKNETSATVH